MKKLFAILLLFAVVAVPRTSRAAEKSWEISHWDTAIRINKDATFDVADTVTFDFTGSFSFVTRAIDFQKFDDITDFQVTDESGTKIADASSLTYDSAQNAYVSTLHFSAQDESRTFIFRYTIHGGIGYFPDHDELYWNILPSRRDVPVQKSHVVVTLPEKVADSTLQHTIYSEGKNLTSRASGSSFTFDGDHFNRSTNFTIVAGFPIGMVANPGVYRIESNPSGADVLVNNVKAVSSTPVTLRASGIDLANGDNTIVLKKFGYQDLRFSLNANPTARDVVTHQLAMAWWYPIFLIGVGLYILHPLFVLMALLVHWWRRGRDPKGRGTIIAQYDPPLHLPPTLVGVLMDERVDMHDLTATIIDLAYRGYLHIKELPKSLLTPQDFELRLEKDFSDDADLRPYEKQFLRALFGDAKITTLKEQREKFYKKIPAITDELYQEATDLKLFQENPNTQRKRFAFGGWALVFIGVFLLGFFALGVPLIFSGFLILIFSRFMPRRTAHGVAAWEYGLGFKEYLYRAERYRVQKLTPELFEKFLSYAMIFKIEKDWAKKFESIYRGSPSWYETSQPSSLNSFAALSLVHSMDRFASSAVQSLTVAPGSRGSGASGSSGFSGGFSGGGGGGGGISAG